MATAHCNVSVFIFCMMLFALFYFGSCDKDSTCSQLSSDCIFKKWMVNDTSRRSWVNVVVLVLVINTTYWHVSKIFTAPKQIPQCFRYI